MHLILHALFLTCVNHDPVYDTRLLTLDYEGSSLGVVVEMLLYRTCNFNDRRRRSDKQETKVVFPEINRVGVVLDLAKFILLRLNEIEISFLLKFCR